MNEEKKLENLKLDEEQLSNVSGGALNDDALNWYLTFSKVINDRMSGNHAAKERLKYVIQNLSSDRVSHDTDDLKRSILFATGYDFSELSL